MTTDKQTDRQTEGQVYYLCCVFAAKKKLSKSDKALKLEFIHLSYVTNDEKSKLI